MPSKKISISFSEHHTDVYNYLKTKQNISNFICELVNSEITAKDTDNSELHHTIETIIEKILKDKQYSITKVTDDTLNENQISLLSEEDKSLIKDLF